MALFYPCVQIKTFLGQMYSFDVGKNSPLRFFQKVPLAPSMCLFKWIKVENGIFSKSARAISKILFNLGSYNFLAYLECSRSYAWSRGHSDPDLSSVPCLSSTDEPPMHFVIYCHQLYHTLPLKTL